MTTANLSQLTDALKKWSADSVKQGAQDVYLFGSLIHKQGVQFSEHSDIDLVVIIPPMANAIERHRWLESFSEHKQDLELQLLRLLRRRGDEPIVSTVAVTDRELEFDIHKDGHRQFFTANTFRSLTTDVETMGIPGAGRSSTDRFVAASLAFAQKIRNEHFAVSANSTPTLSAYIKVDDPLPKRFMRAAAMAARAAGATSDPGAEHDVQEGLDILSRELYDLRNTAPAYHQLQDILSVRRRARGDARPIEPTHQLLLAELIVDLALGSSSSAPSGKQTSGASDGHDQAPRVSGQKKRKTTKHKPAKSKSSSSKATKPVANPARAKPSHTEERKREEEVEERISLPYGSTTTFFAERFASAFPGARSTVWFDDRNMIRERLLRLLCKPLVFADSTPIWWWRGGNLHIERFEYIGDDVFLMNIDELKISRVAAIPGPSYRQHFVYIQTEAMEPTGLYSRSKEYFEDHGYENEEYGLFEGRFITRAEYDDGHATIDGKVVKTVGKAALRSRYITPYNFVIAAHGSPINNPDFDEYLETKLMEALQNNPERAIEELGEAVRRLPLRWSPSN